MQNLENESKIGKVATVAAGVLLAAEIASADLRFVNGYSYIYPNNPPFSGGYCAVIKRFPQGDSTWTGIQPTDGFYHIDLSDLPGGTPNLGETLAVDTYNTNNPNQRASISVIVDTMPHTWLLPSLVMHNPQRSMQPFCVSGNLRDSSGIFGTPRVAFWARADTAYDSVPPFRGNDQYDSLRFNTELLANGVFDGETLHFKIYKGILSDTTSVFTDSSVVVNRQFGNLVNNVFWLRNGVNFPEKRLTHDAGLESILSPSGEIREGDTLIPKARVRNYGQAGIITPVHFAIYDSFGNQIYHDSAETGVIGPESSQVVSFKNWVAVPERDGNFKIVPKHHTYSVGKNGVEKVKESGLVLPREYVEGEIREGGAKVYDVGSMSAAAWTAHPSDVNLGNDTARVNFELTGIVDSRGNPIVRQKGIQGVQSPCRHAVLERIVRGNPGIGVYDVSGGRIDAEKIPGLPEGAYILRYLDKLALPPQKVVLAE